MADFLSGALVALVIVGLIECRRTLRRASLGDRYGDLADVDDPHLASIAAQTWPDTSINRFDPVGPALNSPRHGRGDRTVAQPRQRESAAGFPPYGLPS